MDYFANGSWRGTPVGSYRRCNRSNSRINSRPHSFEVLAFPMRGSALGSIDADCHLGGIDMRDPFGLLRAGASCCRRLSDDRVTARLMMVFFGVLAARRRR